MTTYWHPEAGNEYRPKAYQTCSTLASVEHNGLVVSTRGFAMPNPSVGRYDLYRRRRVLSLAAAFWNR